MGIARVVGVLREIVQSRGIGPSLGIGKEIHGFIVFGMVCLSGVNTPNISGFIGMGDVGLRCVKPGSYPSWLSTIGPWRMGMKNILHWIGRTMMETTPQPTAAGSLSQKTTPTVALLDAIFEAAFDKVCSKEFPTRLAVLPETYTQLKKEVHSMLGNIGEVESL